MMLLMKIVKQSENFYQHSFVIGGESEHVHHYM